MTLSAVIITKNRPQSVERLLNSLKMQTVPPKEVIIVNDGGAPLTFAPSRLLIQQIYHEKSMGAANSRNEGVKKATGNWILMLDDDVELQGPQFIEKAVTNINNNVGIVFPRKIDVTANKLFEFSYFSHSPLTGETKAISLNQIQSQIKEGKIVLGPMVYFSKKQAYEEVGGHDIIFGYGVGHSFREESDFQLRLQKAGYKAALSPESIFKHHIQISGGHGSAVHKKLFWIGHNHVVYRFRHRPFAVYQDLFFAILELPRYAWGSGKLVSYPAGLVGMLAGLFSSLYDKLKN